jgi:acetylglutamate kinase
VALKALSRFAGEWFVVKVGGELVSDRSWFAQSIGRAVRSFLEAQIKVTVIHGAGPQATALSQRLGLEPRTISGRRVTDGPTLEVMKMTLAGQVSVEVAAALRMAGVRTIATTGVSAGLVEAVKRPPMHIPSYAAEPIEMGWVGDVAAINTNLFETMAREGLVLALGSLAGDAQGQIFNINADTVATRVAAALKAAKLFLVSNVPGVLRDVEDPSSRIAKLNPLQARAQIAQGIIRGGMVPKVEESLAMLESGIGSIHIVGIQPPDALVQEVLHPGRFGTFFERA